MGKVPPKRTVEEKILIGLGVSLAAVVTTVTKANNAKNHVVEYVKYRTGERSHVNRNARKEARRQGRSLSRDQGNS